MTAISLWQPWASAVALGSKLVETRSWPIRYRGPIAIHAAKRRHLDELIHFNACWNWQGALRLAGASWGNGKGLHEILPFGALIAIAEVIDCRQTDDFTVGELDVIRFPLGEFSDLHGWTERQMGDFTPGRFGWVLSNVQPFPQPIPFVGHQGLFNVPDELISSLRAA